MKIIDFTKEQLRQKNGMIKGNPLFSRFIKEYIRVFDEKNVFIEKLPLVLSSIVPEVTQYNIMRIKENVDKIKEDVLNEFSEFPDIICFIGTGGWDGHGIIIEDRSYVFFDMSLLNMLLQYETFFARTHLTHEVIHAIHYKFKPYFYPGNCQNIKQKILGKIIAEGISSYFSSKISGVGVRESLTFGFMDEKIFSEWVLECNKLKNNYWNLINDCIKKEQNNMILWNELFFIPGTDPSCLKKGRFGYYYGYDIIDRIFSEIKGTSIFNLSLKEMNGYIEEYFENSII